MDIQNKELKSSQLEKLGLTRGGAYFSSDPLKQARAIKENAKKKGRSIKIYQNGYDEIAIGEGDKIYGVLNKSGLSRADAVDLAKDPANLLLAVPVVGEVAKATSLALKGAGAVARSVAKKVGSEEAGALFADKATLQRGMRALNPATPVPKPNIVSQALKSPKYAKAKDISNNPLTLGGAFGASELGTSAVANVEGNKPILDKNDLINGATSAVLGAVTPYAFNKATQAGALVAKPVIKTGKGIVNAIKGTEGELLSTKVKGLGKLDVTPMQYESVKNVKLFKKLMNTKDDSTIFDKVMESGNKKQHYGIYEKDVLEGKYGEPAKKILEDFYKNQKNDLSLEAFLKHNVNVDEPELNVSLGTKLKETGKEMKDANKKIVSEIYNLTENINPNLDKKVIQSTLKETITPQQIKNIKMYGKDSPDAKVVDFTQNLIKRLGDNVNYSLADYKASRQVLDDLIGKAQTSGNLNEVRLLSSLRGKLKDSIYKNNATKFEEQYAKDIKNLDKQDKVAFFKEQVLPREDKLYSSWFADKLYSEYLSKYKPSTKLTDVGKIKDAGHKKFADLLENIDMGGEEIAKIMQGKNSALIKSIIRHTQDIKHENLSTISYNKLSNLGEAGFYEEPIIKQMIKQTIFTDIGKANSKGELDIVNAISKIDKLLDGGFGDVSTIFNKKELTEIKRFKDGLLALQNPAYENTLLNKHLKDIVNKNQEKGINPLAKNFATNLPLVGRLINPLLDYNNEIMVKKYLYKQILDLKNTKGKDWLKELPKLTNIINASLGARVGGQVAN